MAISNVQLEIIDWLRLLKSASWGYERKTRLVYQNMNLTEEKKLLLSTLNR